MDWIDSAYLPETKGTLDRFCLIARRCDGLLLTTAWRFISPAHVQAGGGRVQVGR